ncbi:GNAT family N-acetyltransferase [Patulibacter brassicae]|uniref:GNAT family N-acetyltransferase n=1 Tax=Patulibacter brassicae TaxID=1705717 RepID=A0ABU4VE82_9ACTN|nr:GNAT family N-acetyltransferase [Patulibacter brassicae]MDX8150103.1 GNAT family N-acetyltransferase [Patulibacter brassicae]
MTDPHGTLRTPRLTVRPMVPADLDALLHGLQDPDRPWAAGYPLDETLIAAQVVDGRASLDDPDALGPWTQYQLVLDGEGVVIGDFTFLSPPDRDRVALITFAIAPERRGNGYATEAVRAIVAWARGRRELRGLRADTDLVNPASHSVLRAAGLAVVHDDGDRQVYELRWERPERIARAIAAD